jgi:hypothetical protein
MERRDLYEDDLTEEREPTPEQRDEVAHTLKGDPDVDSADDEPVEDDDEDEDLDLLDE